MTQITETLYLNLYHIVSLDIKEDYLYIRTVDNTSHMVNYDNQEELDLLLIKLNIKLKDL